MIRTAFMTPVPVVLAFAAVLLLPATSVAQRGGHGGGGGGHGGGGGGHGGGGGGHGGSHSASPGGGHHAGGSSGTVHPHHGSASAGVFYGSYPYRYNYPYSLYPRSYANIYSYALAPYAGDYGFVRSAYYNAAAAIASGGAVPAAYEAPADNTIVGAQFLMPVPNAELWVQGEKMNTAGATRRFISPPLEPGKKYVYNFEARWRQDGQEMSRTRKVAVYAGDRITVEFSGTGPETDSEK